MKGKASRIDLRRGLRWAALLALVGAVVPMLVVFGFMSVGWLASGAEEYERLDDLWRMSRAMILPLIGSATFCGCAAWVTFAPFGNHRFATSLAILFLASLPVWVAVKSFEPPRTYDTPDPLSSLKGTAILFGPLVVGTAVLTVARARRRCTPDPSLE